ncbi:unnamed protein product, partial [Brassica oleracea var. botrytis]
RTNPLSLLDIILKPLHFPSFSPSSLYRRRLHSKSKVSSQTMTIFRTQILAIASILGYVVAPPLQVSSLNNVMVCGFTSRPLLWIFRGVGLHKVAKFENEQQELLRFPQTLFDTKMPAGHTVLQPFADDFSN